MKPIQGYHLIKPEDLHWRLSNLMRIPNADYLERTGQISDAAFASRFLSRTVEEMVRKGERRRLMLSNRAITAFERLSNREAA